MSAITHLIAGVPVSDLDAGIDWYARFFGRPPDLRVGDEILWDIDEHATLFIEPSAEHAGAGRITLAVTGLDALLERLAAESIEHGPIETYANGVRHVNVPDTSRCATRCSCAPCRSARLGRPVVAMPVGMHDGLPFGAQVIARPFAEAVALTVAAACESHTRLGVLSVHMTR